MPFTLLISTSSKKLFLCSYKVIGSKGMSMLDPLAMPYRVVYDDTKKALVLRGVSYSLVSSLCNLKGMSFVRNENLTPYHRELLTMKTTEDVLKFLSDMSPVISKFNLK